MRIATWNINGLRARLSFLLHWLAARQPDVLALQELKLPDEQFPHGELRAAGYHAAWVGQVAWNGVAVLARQALAVIARGLPGQDELGARYLEVEVAGYEVASLYVPNGKHIGHDDFPRKLAWLDALIAHQRARGASGRPRLLAGDFNLCPGPPDTWNEELLRGGLFHTGEERDRFARLLDLGLADLYRVHAPEGRLFSWWDYRAGAFHKNLGLRIDLLLGSTDLQARLREVVIDRDYRKKQGGMVPSDHAPVIAELG